MDVRDWREMGKNREYSYTANGYNRMVITGPQKQEATIGVRAAGFVIFFFF